jgi:D-sedoheptulose 7-phosphate isomerase
MPDQYAASQLAVESECRDALRVLAAMPAAVATLVAIADRITTALQSGSTLYLCGNGGSAADAQHVAAEFVGRFLRERRPLPAVALTTNSSILTAIGNDYDYSEVFARQIVALVKPGDCVVGISTSGRSSNVIKGLEAARRIGASTVGFTGGTGLPLRSLCDECFVAPSDATPRIQECHLLAWHLICNLVEKRVVHRQG